MRFVDHIFDDVVIESATVSVVLPEGVEDVQVRFPNYAGIKRLPDEIFKTYLDTSGRLVISATKNNLVENHIQDFQVQYRLPAWRLMVEPFLVVVAVYLLFVVIIIYVRLDFSISKVCSVKSAHRLQM
jgi:oligosaccharyltransferase complex subunit alpha (ribophorin I)